jgi:hypothetical protein
VINDILWGGRLALLAVVVESGHVSTFADAAPVLERIVLQMVMGEFRC